jgi:hypothetical protein
MRATTTQPFVPAEAGTQGHSAQYLRLWIPACAGMTGEKVGVAH